MTHSYDIEANAAWIMLRVPPATARTVHLDRGVHAAVDRDDLCGLEILNARAWGEWNDATAERVVAWTRKQLRLRAA